MKKETTSQEVKISFNKLCALIKAPKHQQAMLVFLLSASGASGVISTDVLVLVPSGPEIHQSLRGQMWPSGQSLTLMVESTGVKVPTSSPNPLPSYCTCSTDTTSPTIGAPDSCSWLVWWRTTSTMTTWHSGALWWRLLDFDCWRRFFKWFPG